MARPAGHPLAGQSAVTFMRRSRIAAVGQVTWHRHLVVDCWPPPGGSEIVHAEHLEPGRTTISAVALSRLGAQVSFAGVVGDDDEGATLRAALQAEGVDTGWLAIRQGERTATATMIISGTPPERTILRHPGAQIVRGDRLEITALFDHDVVLLDVADAPLRRFLTDLPAHTLPRTRLVAPLTDLVREDLSDALEVALRHDVLIGTERQVRALVRAETLDEAVMTIQLQMRGNNLRSLVIFLGATGCRICTPAEIWNISGFPAAMLNATAAGDAFVAGVVYGIARRWPWPEVGRFANAVRTLSTRNLRAQETLGTLPSLDEVEHFLERHPSDSVR